MPGSSFGNRVTNEIMYMANVLGQGRIPYASPTSTLKKKAKRPAFTSVSSDQLPSGSYMTEPGRVYGVDSEQVGRLGGYMDEMGRVFLPAGNRVTPGSWGGSGVGATGSPGLPSSTLSAPGGIIAGASGASQRAYEAEKSRVAQLTAQDPEFQRYEAARQKAVAPGATTEQVQSAEDIGMQMWAKANPTLAAKVRPGQSGYDAIQGALAGQSAAQGLGYQLPQQMITTPPPGVNAPQGLPGVQSFSPTAPYTVEGGIDIDPEMRKRFQALLNQVKS